MITNDYSMSMTTIVYIRIYIHLCVIDYYVSRRLKQRRRSGNMWQPRQVVAAGASPKEEQLGDWYAEKAKKKSALPQQGWPCRLVDALQAGTTRPAFFDWRTYSFFEASGCCFILKWHHDLEENSLKCWAVSLGNTEKTPLYWYGATVRIAKVCAVKKLRHAGERMRRWISTDIGWGIFENSGFVENNCWFSHEIHWNL